MKNRVFISQQFLYTARARNSINRELHVRAGIQSAPMVMMRAWQLLAPVTREVHQPTAIQDNAGKNYLGI